MIVIITTCSKRHRGNWHGIPNGRTPMTDDAIYHQTLDTIRSIHSLILEHKEIYLIDNSLTPMPKQRIDEVASLGVAYHSYPTTLGGCSNKGFHELELILKFLQFNFVRGPVLKISARYILSSAHLVKQPYPQLRGKLIRRRRGFSEISTAAYLVGDAERYKALLDEARRQTYMSIYRFYTPFLFRRFVNTSIMAWRNRTLMPFRDPEISIEEGFYHAANKLSLEVDFLGVLGVKGILASEEVLIEL